jgi:hypothetical protein
MPQIKVTFRRTIGEMPSWEIETEPHDSVYIIAQAVLALDSMLRVDTGGKTKSVPSQNDQNGQSL